MFGGVVFAHLVGGTKGGLVVDRRFVQNRHQLCDGCVGGQRSHMRNAGSAVLMQGGVLLSLDRRRVADGLV